MGSSKFSVSSGSKYELGQLLVDGYNELILGENNCEFTSAIFYAEVQAQPMGIVISEPFYTSTNLNDIPSDNLWYNKVKTLLLQIKGVENVEIDPINNKFDIVSDVNNSEIIDGSVETMRISIDLNIEYNIKCR